MTALVTPMVSFGKTPLPTVQLRHELADGTQHVDWMLARDEGENSMLLSFRCTSRLDALLPGQAEMIQHIGDHRMIYLQYEGMISEERGKVSRLCDGMVAYSERPLPSHDAWHVIVHWTSPGQGGLQQHLRIIPQKHPKWLVFCVGVRRCFEAQ